MHLRVIREPRARHSNQEPIRRVRPQQLGSRIGRIWADVAQTQRLGDDRESAYTHARLPDASVVSIRV